MSAAEESAFVTTALENDIIFGRLPPGTRLIEDALMARYGKTRHAVRQALVELERTGSVTRERHVGATVRRYTNSAPARIAARHVSVSSTVPTPISARPANSRLASAIVLIASGEVIVISSAVTPPSSSASQIGRRTLPLSTRMTATMPG